jgi:serine/threonine protein kinase
MGAPAEIYLEWAQNGSLETVFDLVKSRRPPSFWNPTGISIIVCGIVLGMRHVHSRGFIHQDLNPSNILLNDKGRVLISDFGSARDPTLQKTPDPSGTEAYTAPELRYGNDWDSSVDVYSFGLILYEILVGSPGFRENEPESGMRQRMLRGAMPLIGPGVLPSMRDLIQKCWQLEADRRPSFEAILGILESCNFTIMDDVDDEIARQYVNGVRKWEADRAHIANGEPGSPI